MQWEHTHCFFCVYGFYDGVISLPKANYSKALINDCRKKYLLGWSLTEISKHYKNSPSISTLSKWKDQFKWDRTAEFLNQKMETKLVDQLSDVLVKIQSNEIDLIINLLTKIKHLLINSELSSRDIDFLSRSLYTIIKAKGNMTKDEYNKWEDIFNQMEGE